MNNLKRKSGPDTDLRGLLKHHHRKVYSICRLFANNYKEHQRLFSDIISAASQNMRFVKGKTEKHLLLLRACINMAALHTIQSELQQVSKKDLQFKSHDFQRIMVRFRESVGEISDLEKFRLFLELEKVSPEEIADLTGMIPAVQDAGQTSVLPGEKLKKNFIPYLKEKLIWN